jgi:hypothetical protein
MSFREIILNQLPYSGVLPSVPAPSPEEISAALQEVLADRGVTDRDSARIAAFAWYHGIESEAVLGLFRTRGTRHILQQELGSYRDRRFDPPENIPNRAFRRLSGFMLARELGMPELGWAIAVLTVAEAADLGAIVESLAPEYDPLRIASYFIAAPRFVPPHERRTLIAKLLTLGDPISLEAAIAIFSWWIEAGVERGDMDLKGVFAEIEQNALGGAVLLGSVLCSTQRYQSPPFPREVADRATEIERLIDEAGKSVFANRITVNKALTVEGIRYLDVLAAMSRWRNDANFASAAGSKALRYTVAQHLQDAFSTRQNLTIDGGAMKPHLSKWSIEPLVEITLHDGIEVDVFQNYFEALATDSFSQLTRHRTFLEDRQRGIVLLAVAGLVAYERSDAALLEAAKKAANRLVLQPAGVVEVLDARKRQEFAEKCGFILPEK